MFTFWCERYVSLDTKFLMSIKGSNWSYTTHLELLQLSAAAYCPYDRLQKWNCRYCPRGIEPIAFLQGVTLADELELDADASTFGFVAVDHTNKSSTFTSFHLHIQPPFSYCKLQRFR